MRIDFHPSAFKHGISRGRSLHVITHCLRPIYRPNPDDPDEENLTLFLGPDQRGVPLEVIGIELGSDNLLVIHAMRMRRRYSAQYAEVTG